MAFEHLESSLNICKACHRRLVAFIDYHGLRMTSREYVFDVISVGQCSSPWPFKLSESRDKFLPQVQALFSSCTIYVAANALT